MGFTGSAPNKTFVRTDGTYTGATVYAQEKAASIGIVETNLDATEYDMAQGINSSLQKDGANKMTGIIDAGAYGFSDLAVLASATEVTIASSTTTDLLGSAALFNAISGTVTITSLGTGTNRLKVARFTGILTLTHNASSLILPGGANITTAAGDTMVVTSDGSSSARVIAYQAASGGPVTFADASITLAKIANMATASFLGRNTASTGVTEVLSESTAKTMLNAAFSTANFIIDGAGAAITTGIKGYIGPFDFACTIAANTLLGDQSGSIVVNLWKTTYSAFDVSTHPVVGDKITSSTPPTISTAVKSTDSTLTSWTTAIAVGDVLAVNVDSCTSITRCTLSLKLTK